MLAALRRRIAGGRGGRTVRRRRSVTKIPCWPHPFICLVLHATLATAASTNKKKTMDPAPGPLSGWLSVPSSNQPLPAAPNHGLARSECGSVPRSVCHAAHFWGPAPKAWPRRLRVRGHRGGPAPRVGRRDPLRRGVGREARVHRVGRSPPGRNPEGAVVYSIGQNFPYTRWEFSWGWSLSASV